MWRANRKTQTEPLTEEITPDTKPVSTSEEREQLVLMHDELNHLPEKYRGPLVLCCLEGLSRQEAAKELQLSESSIKARLGRGRELLKKRLLKRGIALATVLTLWQATQAQAATLTTSLVVQQTVNSCLAQSSALGTGSGTSVLSYQGAIEFGGFVTKVLAFTGFVSLMMLGGISLLMEPELAESSTSQEAKTTKPATQLPGAPQNNKLHAQFLGNKIVKITDNQPASSNPALNILQEVGSDRFYVPGYVSQVTYTPDGKWITALCQPGKPENTFLGFWDIHSGELVRKLQVGEKEIGTSKYEFIQTENMVLTFGSALKNNSITGLMSGWNTKNEQKLFTHKRHDAQIFSHAFSSDEKFVATCDTTGLIKVSKVSTPEKIEWSYRFTQEPENSQNIRRTHGSEMGRREREDDKQEYFGGGRRNNSHVYFSTIIKFSPDNQKLVVCDIDSSFAYILDVQQGELLRKLNLNLPVEAKLNFSTVLKHVSVQEQRLLIATQIQQEVLVRGQSGRPVRSKFTHSLRLDSRDLQTGEIIPESTREYPLGSRSALSLSGDLLTLSHIEKTKVINLKNDQVIQDWETRGVLNEHIAYSPDERSLTTVIGGTLIIYDLKTGKHNLPEDKHHLSPVNEIAIIPASSPNLPGKPKELTGFIRSDQELFLTRDDGNLALWVANSGKPVFKTDKKLYHLSFSHDQSMLAYLSPTFSQRPVRKNIIVKNLVEQFSLKIPVKQMVDHLALSADGGRLAFSYQTSYPVIEIWNIPKSKEKQSELKQIEHYPNRASRRIKGGHVHSLKFANKGETLLALSDQGELIKWDLTKRSGLRQFNVFPFTTVPELNRHYQYPIQSASISPDGHTAVIQGRNDPLIYVWDVDQMKIRKAVQLPGKDASIDQLVFSPDSQFLALTSVTSDPGQTENPIRFLDTKSGQQLMTFQPEPGNAVSLGISSDGQRLITGHPDGTARVWDLSSLKSSSPETNTKRVNP